MANSEFDEKLQKIANLIEADRREWQERREADRLEWQQRLEAERQEWEARFKRHDDILLVHAKLVLDNEREWKQQVADLWEVIKNHESRLDSDRDALRNLMASMDSLVKTVEDFIKGLNRQNGHQQ